jgi:ribosomal protein L6P/L9E
LLKLGYSHYIRFLIPESLYIVGYKKRLIIFGALPADVKQFALQIVRSRQPDVYKNKGVQLVGRVFRLKIGKQK